MMNAEQFHVVRPYIQLLECSQKIVIDLARYADGIEGSAALTHALRDAHTKLHDALREIDDLTDFAILVV